MMRVAGLPGALLLRLRVLAAVSVALMLCLVTFPIQAHNGVVHGSQAEARAHDAAEPAVVQPKSAPPKLPANTPGFPIIKGGDFALVDQHKRVRTSRDPDGRHQLVFFGYANCQAICSVALPRMAEAVDALQADGIAVTPVLITVDSMRDTVETLGPAVKKIHTRMVGLTGSDRALNAAYAAFQVDRKKVFHHPQHGPVYSHGSYIYLLAPDGEFRTLLPPVLAAARIAEVVRGYVRGGG